MNISYVLSLILYNIQEANHDWIQRELINYIQNGSKLENLKPLQPEVT